MVNVLKACLRWVAPSWLREHKIFQYPGSPLVSIEELTEACQKMRRTELIAKAVAQQWEIARLQATVNLLKCHSTGLLFFLYAMGAMCFASFFFCVLGVE